MDKNKINKSRSIRGGFVCLAVFSFALTNLPAIANVNEQNEKGETALMWAVFNQNLVEVQKLMREGADPRLAKNDGATSYSFALWGKSPEIKKLVLNYQDPNTGETLLLKEIFEKNLPKVEKLLIAGANPYLAKKDGADAYFFALLPETSPDMRKLVLNYQDLSSGETRLMREIFHKNFFKVQELLNGGADPYLAKKDGARGIDFAMWSDSRLVTDSVINREYEDGSSPLARAVMLKSERDVEELLKAGADPLFKNNKGQVALDLDALRDSATGDQVMKRIDDLIKTAMDHNAGAKDAQGNFLKTLSLFEEKKHDDSFMNAPFSSGSGLNIFFLNNSDNPRKLPNAPVFHKYQVASYFPFHAKFPDYFNEYIPANIKSELSRHDIDELEVFFVVQRLENGYLFRPHYWADPNMPQDFDGVRMERYFLAGMYNPSSSIESALPDALKTNELRVFMFSAHHSLVSPKNAMIHSYGQALSVWTVVIDSDSKKRSKKAAVTLHWLIPDFPSVRGFGRMIAGGVIDGKNYGEKVNNLNELVAKILSHDAGDSYRNLLDSLSSFIPGSEEFFKKND